MNAVEDTQLLQFQLLATLQFEAGFLALATIMAMNHDDEDSRFYTKVASIIAGLIMVTFYRLDQIFTNNAMSLPAIGFLVALCIALAIACYFLVFGPRDFSFPFGLILVTVITLGGLQVTYFYARFDPDNTKATIEHTVDHCPCPPDQAPLGEQK